MKKILVTVTFVLAIALAVGIAAPIVADDPGSTSPPTAQAAGRCGRAVLLARLLLIQDEAKVQALLDKAIENGRITEEQADKIQAYWTLHHEKAAKRAILRGLRRIQDEDKLMEIVNRALENGRITQEQAEKIIAAWHKIHSK